MNSSCCEEMMAIWKIREVDTLKTSFLLIAGSVLIVIG